METQSPFTITRIDTLAQLDTLKTEWTDLVADIPEAPVFLTWEWIRTWWFHFGTNCELWLLVARDKHGHLQGLAPLMKQQHRVGLLNLRTLAFIGTSHDIEVHNDFLARPPYQEGVSRAFLNFLTTQSNQWDVIRFSSVTHESGLNSLFASAGGRYRQGIDKLSAYIPLPGDWDAYLKTRSKKLQRNLRYFRSKLDASYPGSVGFSCITDPQKLPGAIKTLETLNKNRWHEKDRICNFDYTNFSAFHQAIASLALDRGWLRLNQLTVAEQVVAMCYNFRFHDRMYAHVIGFDLDWSDYSPGRLAIAYSIKAAIQEGAREYDWGAGDHAYKLAWTDQVHVEKDILFSNNKRGGIYIEWGKFKDDLIAAARVWLPQATRDRLNRIITPRYRKTEKKTES